MIPLLILGAAAIIGTGGAVGLALQEPDKIINNQTTNQTDNFYNYTWYEFENIKGNIEIDQNATMQTKKETRQTSNQEENGEVGLKVLAVGGLAVGTFLVLRGKKK
jgi:hypothetical protein